MTEKDINLGRCFELATANKIYVNSFSLHEIKKDILLFYTGDFEIVGSTLFGELEQNTNIRFRIIAVFITFY